MLTIRHTAYLAAGALLAVGLSAPASMAARSQAPPGNAVARWNATAAEAATAAQITPAPNPLHESRMYALAHLAIHDALNAIEHRARPYAFKGYEPYAHPDAAIAAAARTTLVAALRDLAPPFNDPAAVGAAIAKVEAAYTSELARIPDGSAKAKGVRLGEKAADALLDVRADDGANEVPLIDPAFPQGDEPGEYRFTPGSPFAFAPTWGDVVEPFGLKRADQFAVAPPLRLRSDAYAKDFNEVKRLGSATSSERTADETEIARFWVESSPLAWNRLARQLSTSRDLDRWESARLFGLLNIALTDGYIATFKTKYDTLFWRPVTAIHLANTDGNRKTTADLAWASLEPTPAIPDHDSGHSVEGGAAAAVLRGFFHTDRVRFELCSFTVPEGGRCDDDHPVWRSYGSFSEAAKENARSRVLVGFHFGHATRVGTEHGTKIGKYAVLNYLQPRS